MEDEIPFIRNIEDYENYKKLRPTKIYQRKKVRFICHSCQNESIKGFRSLTPDFLCIHCQARQGTLNASDKFKETCIKKYGVSSYNKTDEFKERYKNTCLDKYGVTNIVNVPEIQEKIKQTNLEKYGYENPMSSDEIKEKMFNTKLKRYGNPYYTGINTGTIFSKFEKSVLDFIKEKFSNLIIEENNRTILNGKEIDLYFPEIQKGIEINGDYWHCNPLIYESTYINRKGKTAEEIWKRDNEKYNLAKEQKIELLIIWEYDWMHNKNIIQENIETFLNI